MLDAGGIRKFYRFQSRLMKGGLSVLFGVSISHMRKAEFDELQAKFQEMYLQLSYLFVSNGALSTPLPDVLGTVARARASSACASVAREVAQIGKWVCNSHEVQYHEKSLLRYAKAVTQIDLAFFESIRDNCATGLEAFDTVGKRVAGDEKQARIHLRQRSLHS